MRKGAKSTSWNFQSEAPLVGVERKRKSIKLEYVEEELFVQLALAATT